MTEVLKDWGVPWADPTGQVWPVSGEPKLVSVTTASGVVHGNAATAFHAARTGPPARFHAGMDLVANPGDAIVAMEPGRVLGQVPGYVRLGAVVVEHARYVAVYAEIELDSLAKAGLKAGDTVSAGQVIGRGALNDSGRSMLHLELWEKAFPPKGFTPWFVGSSPPKGLLDPSLYLLDLSLGKATDKTGASTHTMKFPWPFVGAGFVALGAWWATR